MGLLVLQDDYDDVVRIRVCSHSKSPSCLFVRAVMPSDCQHCCNVVAIVVVIMIAITCCKRRYGRVDAGPVCIAIMIMTTTVIVTISVTIIIIVINVVIESLLR